MPYKIIGIGLNRVVESRSYPKAPSDALVIGWAHRRKLDFAARYFPSRKGWMLFDLRKAQPIQKYGGAGRVFDVWVGQERLMRVYATEDGAVMHAMAILGGQIAVD